MFKYTRRRSKPGCLWPGFAYWPLGGSYLRALPRACALDALLRRLAADGWGGFGGVPLVSGSRTRGLCLDQRTTGWSVGGGRVGVAAGLLTGPTVGDVWSGDALDGDGDLWWEACVLEYTRKTSEGWPGNE